MKQAYIHQVSVRTHFVLPKTLKEELEKAVEPRRRSVFVAAAVAERLERLRQHQALERAAGMLKNADIPAWATPEQASA